MHDTIEVGVAKLNNDGSKNKLFSGEHLHS